MGLLDSVLSAATGGGNQTGNQASLLSALVEHVNSYPGGLSGLVQKLQQGGLGDAVSSWVGTGANQAVSGEQVQSALGDDVVNKLAQSSGQDSSTVLNSLSTLLPHLVDHATPNGAVDPAQGGLNVSSLMGSLSGLLGKLG